MGASMVNTIHKSMGEEVKPAIITKIIREKYKDFFEKTGIYIE